MRSADISIVYIHYPLSIIYQLSIHLLSPIWPPHTYLFSGGGGRTWVQKLSTNIFKSDFGHFIFKRYQTVHSFEMLLIEWKCLYASGGPSKIIWNRYWNRMTRLTVTELKFTKKVATIEKYFFLVIYFIE